MTTEAIQDAAPEIRPWILAVRQRLDALEHENDQEEYGGEFHEYELGDAGKALFDNAVADLTRAVAIIDRIEPEVYTLEQALAGHAPLPDDFSLAGYVRALRRALDATR